MRSIPESLPIEFLTTDGGKFGFNAKFIKLGMAGVCSLCKTSFSSGTKCNFPDGQDTSTLIVRAYANNFEKSTCVSG